MFRIHTFFFSLIKLHLRINFEKDMHQFPCCGATIIILCQIFHLFDKVQQFNKTICFFFIRTCFGVPRIN